MKHFWKIFLPIFFVAALIGASAYFHAESAPAGENRTGTEKSARETFKVGYLKDSTFLWEDRPGHKVGYGYDYMEFLAGYAQCNFEYVECKSWAELCAKMAAKEIDLMPGMPGDWHTVPNAKRTDHVIGRFPMQFVTKGGKVKPNMKIGRIPTDYPTPGLDTLAKGEDGFTYEFVMFPGYDEMRKAFDAGDIDGYVCAMLGSTRTSDVVAMFDRQSYRLLVRNDNQALFDRMNAAMDQMLLLQPNIRNILAESYSNSSMPIILTPEEKRYLAEKKKLRAVILLSSRPYAFIDENQKISGLIPEIVRRTEKDLNIEIELVVAKNFPEAIGMIQNGEADFIADTVSDHSEATKNGLELTQPYETLEFVAVTPENTGEKSTEPVTVACVGDMLYTKTFIEPKFPADRIIRFENQVESLKAVNDGRAGVTYVPRIAAGALIEEADTFALQVHPEALYFESLSFGVYAEAPPELWSILNKEVGHIETEWINDELDKNQQHVPHFSLKRIIYHHPISSSIFIIFVALVAGGILFYRNKMRERHIELVQHMAYTDLRYSLPNVPSLERDVPEIEKKLASTEPDKKLFFVVFAVISSATATEEYGRDLIDKKFLSIAKEIGECPNVLLTAAGIDVDHLICVCKANNEEEIVAWAEGKVAEYGYMETADAQAKIILHTRAGISAYTHSMYVRQAIDKAVAACHRISGGEVKLFDEKMEETLATQHEIESRMEQALRDDEFKAWYQPKYDIRTRRIVGAEALVRWISPVTGFMPPGKFIPLFEHNGFVIQVDYHLLEKTFQLQKERLEAGKEVVPISVNQSRLHMTEDGYLDKMRAIVEKYNLPPGLIELEVTETVFGDFDAKTNRENAAKIVQGLHDLGFTVSVDDFGSGYSSFMMLSYLPMDVMKIDRSLLTSADTSERAKEILGNVIKLGHALDMKVICEGIETPEQEKLLLELGCVYGQGFYNAKPMPVADFIDFFEKRNAEVSAKRDA